MKATITITGQVNGNSIIASKINSSDFKKTKYGGYLFNFNTKKEAVKALHDAYKSLKSDESETKMSYAKGNILNYDDSCARIDII